MIRKSLIKLGAAKTSFIITAVSILSSVSLYVTIGKLLNRIENIGILISIIIPAIVAPLLSYFFLRILLKLDVAEKALVEINRELELRVEERTDELAKVNEELQAEITERKQAEEALKRRLEQLTSLSQASQAVTASLELDQVLAEIVSLASEVVALDYASVVLVDKEGRVGQSAECLPGVPAIDCCIRTEGFTSWIVRSHQTVVVDDIDEDGIVDPKPANGAPRTANPLVVEAGVKSFVGLPLVAKDRLLGVLYLHSLRPGNFRDQLPLLTTFASQVAIAIENARLYQTERKRAAQLAVVNQVARQATSILDLDQFLQEIVAAIQQGFGYYNVALFLLDEDASELEMKAITGGFKNVVASEYHQAVGVGMIGWTAETGQPLLANDVSQEPHYIPGFLEEPLTRSELCVPLTLASQVIGVLDVQDTQLNAFDEMDLLAMETLADQIAVGIESVRLFRETKHRFEETMALYQTSLDITAQLEMPGLLKSIVERAVVLLRAEAGSIYLYDLEREELRLAIGYDYTEKYVGVTLKPGEGMAGKVFQTGEPLIVDDYRTWEGRASAYEADQPFTAVLEVPLKWQERIIGVLSIVADARKRTLNQDDVWLATLFATQAAVAIENARLYAREKRQKVRLARFNEISRSINARLDLRTVLAEVVEAAALILDTEYSTLFLLDAESQVLIPYVTCGHDWEQMKEVRFALGEGLAGWVAETGQPLNVTDTATDPRFVSISPDLDQYTSMLLVPLIHEKRVVGVLTADRKEGGAFSEEDQLLLATLADQAAVAIENARLYEAEAQRGHEAETLRQAAMALTSTLDLEETLDRILEQLHRVVAYDSASVQLLRGDHLEIVGGRGFADPSVVIGLRFPVPGDNPNTRVIESGEPVILADAQAAHAPFRQPPHDHIRSWLGVPMRFREQTIGLITLDSIELGHFTADQARLAAAFANQAAIAIENARLFEETRKRMEQTQLLLRVSEATASALDSTEVMRRIAREVAQVLGADMTSAYLLDEMGKTLWPVAGYHVPPEWVETYREFRIPVEGHPFVEEAWRSQRTIFTNDAASDSRFDEETYRLFHARSVLLTPMIVKDAVIGGLWVVWWEETHHFTEEERRLVEGIVRQAAVAIENARLYEQVTALAAELEVRVQERTEELAHKAQELSFLYQASVALSSSLERDEVLNILAQQAALAVDAMDCTICELQDDALVAVACYWDPALPRENPEIGRRYLLADYPATREAIERVQPLWVRVDDPLADKAERAELQKLGYTALLQVHIVSQGQVVGVVEVFDNKSKREFSESDAALLQTIANQAGMAMEKAHLFQQIRQERNHLALLYDVSRKLSASLDPEQALRDILQVGVTATTASRGSVFVFDDKGRISYRILTRNSPLVEARKATDQVLHKGLAGWVLKQKQPTIVFDTSQDERWLSFHDDAEPAGSAMTIPFIERGQVRGLLTLVHPQPSHFNQAHLDLLSSIAHQVAVVIERAQLYEETRRRAQEVAQQKEQTDAIVQSMADGLIVTDLKNRLVLANPAAEELLKFRLEDAIGQDIGANIRDDRLRQIVRDTLDKQQAGYEVDIELAAPHDGIQRIMRAHTAVVNNPVGQPMGIVTTLRDVTHEREVQRLKDELVSTVSHELRTPMASVLGFSELLLTRQLSEEKRQLYIQTIHKEAQRLSALISDFLDIQRMRRGKQEYHFKEVNLDELVHEMVATYSGQSDAHTLTMDLTPDLPFVQADPDRLRQVFGNLLSNAIKFSPDGGTVAVSVQAKGDEIHVAVSDEGIGIPANALPHIFERFFRVDRSDQRAIKGTGLGLAICKEIVEAHRGRIWAKSREGVGTTVTFSLPLTTKKRILVIDDEKDIRDMFQKLLSEKDYEVLTAANGQKGLSLMEEKLPDLVILDIAMPVMDGYQFLEKVKENRQMKDIPVITISGVDTDIDRLKALGTDEFLSKPFSSTVLLDTMRRLLKRS